MIKSPVRLYGCVGIKKASRKKRIEIWERMEEKALYSCGKVHNVLQCKWFIDLVIEFWGKGAASVLQICVRQHIPSMRAAFLIDQYLGSLHSFVQFSRSKGLSNGVIEACRRHRYNKLRRCLVPLFYWIRKGFPVSATPPRGSPHRCGRCGEEMIVHSSERMDCHSHPPRGYVCYDCWHGHGHHDLDHHYVYGDKRDPLARSRREPIRFGYTPCRELVRANNAELIDFVLWVQKQ